jgi:phosphate transport system protein
MSVHFSQELDELKKKLLVMASNAETAVSRAIKAMVDRDDDLARRVREDDSILDEFEKEIDEISISLLAKAPLASELRLITVAMKISHDLERVGDEATTISRRVLELNKEPQLHTEVDLPAMAEKGLKMLKEALEAFVNRDTAKARAVIPRDKQIDSLNKQLQRELASYMVERPSTITRCLNLMTISKSLERIGDHATNIAEEVVYLHEGEDIRHDPRIKQGGAA